MTTESDDEMVLAYFDDRGGWYIAWSDGDGPGMCLGEQPGDQDHTIATEAASKIGDPHRERNRSDGRLLWESEVSVRKALRSAKAAVKAARDGIPLPDWATKATSEGWKPPKDWKPRRDDNIGPTPKF